MEFSWRLVLVTLFGLVAFLEKGIAFLICFAILLPFSFSFTKKSPKTTPTPLQNPSKKHPENTSKINTTFQRFWIQNGLPNDARNLQKSTRGALWGHMGTNEAQKGGQASPGDPKMEVQARPGHHFHHFWNLVCMFFNIIHDLLSTMPNYVRINIQRQKMKE